MVGAWCEVSEDLDLLVELISHALADRACDDTTPFRDKLKAFGIDGRNLAIGQHRRGYVAGCLRIPRRGLRSTHPVRSPALHTGG